MAAEALRTSDQSLPKRIGRYEAFLQIGAGGMARVYLAVQRGLAGQKAELVVVKVLRPEVLEDEHVSSLFADEARIAMRLQHPNVIRTREVIAEPPDYLLAMDFHDGRSLLDVVSRLGRQGVPLHEHIYVLGKVLAGLSYAHEFVDESGQPSGIVHRDVSPANVLVSYGGEVKLLDFGIAKATGALAVTRDGVVRGKLGYAAPEQCLGKPADPRSDIYAVGVMLWEAIAGRRRASGETWQSVMQARLDDAEPALEEVCPDAPPALMAIVRRALARNPDDRYATAREFQANLEKYLRDQGGPPIGPARLAAMLKPHFDQDRADLRRSVEGIMTAIRSGKTAQAGRLPLPGKRPASPVVAAQEAPIPEASGGREETTAPIPVDSALLMLSRGETESGPASSTPTIPPPGSSTPTAPPPPPTTARPPADLPPPSAAFPSVEPGELSLESPLPPTDPTPAVAGAPAFAAAPAPAVLPLPPKPAPVAVDAFGLVAVPSAVPVPDWASNAAGAAPPKKISLWPFLLLGAGALGLGAFLIVPRLGASKESAAKPAQPAEATRSPSATKASSAAKVDTVKVRISVDPADALVTLDGRELSGNPYVAVLPRDNAAHELAATAEGCKDQHQVVHLNGDLAVLVAMKCARQGLRLSGRPGVRRPAAAAPAAPAPGPVAPATPVEPADPAPASDENPYK